MSLLCQWGLHRWVHVGVVTVHDYHLFGLTTATGHDVNRCRACLLWDIKPSGLNLSEGDIDILTKSFEDKVKK